MICAAALGNDWRLLVLATAVPLALLFIVQYAAPESPRHMLVGGDAAGAARVLEQIHATNRTPWAKAEAHTLELADPMALASRPSISKMGPGKFGSIAIRRLRSPRDERSRQTSHISHAGTSREKRSTQIIFNPNARDGRT